MRLICPNCGAQYEVADDAIPASGRDVQCSNCGHGWFQHAAVPEAVAATVAPTLPPEPPAEIVADARAAEPAQDHPAGPIEADETEGAHAADPDLAPEPTEGELEEPDPEPASQPDLATSAAVAAAAAPAIAATAQRSLDDNLLAVLREEAEREVAKRKAEDARGLQTQAELAIDTAPSAPPPPPAAAARRPGAKTDFSHLSSDSDFIEDVPEASVRPAARRDLLPDVEVISSTLRSSGAVDDDDNPMPDLPPIRRSSGFRSGFLLSVLLAVLVVVAYVLAPRLAEQFPAAKGALDSYVATIDGLRAWIGTLVASLNGRLES